MTDPVMHDGLRKQNLRGTTIQYLKCLGCRETDTKVKLVVAGFGQAHPKCFREWLKTQ